MLATSRTGRRWRWPPSADWQEDEAQNVFSIQDAVAKGLSANLSVRLYNQQLNLRDRNELALAARVLALSRDVAAALGEHQQDTLV